jgi:transcriptional regulator with XRE-family HTH domain
MDGRVDVAKLYEALDTERRARGNLPWRQLAQQAGVSPSLLSRMGNKQRPDLDGFIALVQWLGGKAETFMLTPDDQPTPPRQTDLTTEVAVLLRARDDLDDTDKVYLQEIFEATLRKVRSDREVR